MSTPTQASAIQKSVRDAIKLRTDALAKRAKDEGDSLSEINYYYNSKTPWIKMTSSANVNGSSALARKYVLGTLAKDESPLIPSGMEVNSTFGIRPKPHITSMNCFHHGRYGALRDITVEFECFSREQLDDLEKLFMRPGVSVLVEWGHSLSLTGSGDDLQVKPVTNTYSSRILDGGSRTLAGVNSDLKKLRKTNGYDYDAGFGIIKNFDWSFTGAGPCYKCKVILCSPGEAIGSLQTTQPLPDILALKYKAAFELQKVYDANDSLFRILEKMFSGVDNDNIPDISLEDRMPLLASVDEVEISSILKTFVAEDLIKYFHRKVLEGVRRNAASGYTDKNYENEDGSSNPLTINSKPRITKVWYYGLDYWDTEDSDIEDPLEDLIEDSTEDSAEDSADSLAVTPFLGFDNQVGYIDHFVPGGDYIQTGPMGYAKDLDGNVLRTNRPTPDAREPHITGVLGIEFKMLTLFFKEEVELDPALLEGSDIRSNLVDGEIEFWERWRTFSYIRYGDFLEVLSKMVLLSNDRALFKFDTSTTQKFRKPKVMQSIDPSVCLLPGDVNLLAKDVAGFRKSGDLVSIVDIALNVENLYETLKRVNGSYTDLLSDINDQISANTGTIVELDVHYFEHEAMFAIVDRTRQGDGSTPEVLPLLGTHSMTRDFSIKTSIDNKLATSIATSVSSGGARDDLEKTLLNFHSNGVSDRNLPKIDTYPKELTTSTTTTTTTNIVEAHEEVTQRRENASHIQEVLKNIYTYGTYSQVASQGARGLLTHFIQERTPKKELGGMIIPYKLNVTLDGISGLRVMDAFTISSNFLPATYNSNLRTGNLITGLNQSVNKTEWTVEVTSQYYNVKKYTNDNKTEQYIDEIYSNEEEVFDNASFLLNLGPTGFSQGIGVSSNDLL